MGVVDLADVRAGMVLHADVMQSEDRLLIAAGTELTDKHLRTLAMWGVVEVDIQGLSRADLIAKAAAAMTPGERAAVETQVQTLFRHNDRGHPLIERLVELTTMRLIRQAAGTGDAP